MQVIMTIGNRDLPDREKTLFLCSKRTPIELYEYVFKWTDSLSDKDCIACFNSTDMEAEVLKALLVSKIPTVLFVMNRFTDINNLQIERALQENRMLIVVLRRDEPRGKGATPRLRNAYVLSLCQHVVSGFVNKNGMVFSLLAGKNNVRSLIDENEYQMAAEQDVRNERWTVAQDKVLLRMYYCDMGIHAIHKCLQRTYAAVYARIHSITQPEELLKGREFEDYVLSLFNLQEDGLLILQEWQGDKSYGLVKPENNSNPDFVFRYNQKEFAIECKWRERLDADMSKDIFTKKRLDNYKKFSEERKMSVAIILGIGGEPCAPELLYIIPLDKITDIISYEKSINSFRIFPNNFDISCVMPARERVNSYTVEEKRKLYKNAYKKWSIEEDEQLLSLFGENKSIEELTIVFNRNEGAIRSRINKLAQKRK